jgi:cysteine synthase A
VSKRFENILETIGRTPVVKIQKLAPKGVNLYVKVEAFNPMGSVKDRLALGIIEEAEHSGKLKPGQTVIEATSGNTGIGLAMVCAQKGYPLVVTMAENFSIERRKMLRFLGAKVVLTPASEKGSGMLTKAEELAKKHGWFLCRQFENEANAAAHSKTTAPEILEAFEGERLDYWVSGYGTGGTLKGVARVLKEQRPDIKIVACEPDNAQILGSGIAQQRDADGHPLGSHPSFRPHLMQGWSPDFIPRLTEDAVSLDLIDEICPVNGADALRMSRELARQEGIFVGISAGATLAAALKVCESAPRGTTVLAMLPDTGERYLSTPLFEHISEEMNDEEMALSGSTPGFRFDVRPPAPEPERVGTTAQAVPTEAGAFLDEVLSDTANPVVMFALEWCEFSWSVRKMFAKYEIPYRSIDLDSVAYQSDDRGGNIRQALNSRFSVKTIPQIFVGGQLVGGCTEVFDAQKNGTLDRLLAEHNVRYNKSVDVDPYTFLPNWLHKRRSAA